MAGVEDLLRDELRSTQPALPTREAMVARVGRARRRRVAVTAVAGAVGLIGFAVVAYAIPVGLTGPRFGGEPARRTYSNEVVNTIFTDRQHGYVAQQRCSMDVPGEVPDGAPTPDVHRECRTQLLATADGGQTWQERALPADPATKDAGVELRTGHSLMLWRDSGGTLAFGSWDRRYWTSADAGITWQESPSPRDMGPAGSYGTFGPDDTLAFLANPPPVATGGKNPVVSAADGSFWAAADPGTDPGAVVVTRDHGVTWQVLSTLGDAQSVAWVSTVDGVTVYAGVRTASGSRLARSTDGGATWNRVLDLARPSATGLVLANGDVLLAEATEQGGVFRLAAGAQVLEPRPDMPAHPGALYTSGGVVVAAGAVNQDDPHLEPVLSLSFDEGATWTDIPSPID